MNTKERVKAFVGKQIDKIGLASALVLASGATASANDLSGVTTAIEGASGNVKTEAIKVITAALGVGIVFWGAKKLWRSFKSI